MNPWPFAPMPPGVPPLGPQQPQQRPKPQPTRGPNFTYFLPPGWQVVEEGKCSLCLKSQQDLSGIIVYGTCGMMQPIPPEHFVYNFMTHNMQAMNVQFTQVKPIQPMPGYTHAALIDVQYLINMPTGPAQVNGLVISNVVVVYGRCDAIMTLVASDAQVWPQNERWLPELAFAAYNTGPDPYGRHSMSSTLIGSTMQEQAAFEAYNSWSQNLWSQVIADRHRSIDYQNEERGELLTGNQWVTNPFTGHQIQVSTTPAVIWINRDGRTVSSQIATFDPRTPYDNDWCRLS